MIIKKFDISNIKAPVTWSWTLDNCLDLVQAVLTDGILEAEFELCNCNDASGTLTVTDADDCKHTIEFDVEDPCLAFTATIEVDEDCDGCGVEYYVDSTKEVTIEWDIDPEFAVVQPQTNGQIKLQALKSGATKLYAKLTTIENCIKTISLDLTLCVPTHTKEIIATTCFKQETSGWFTPNITNTCGTTIDWNTFEIVNPPFGFVVSTRKDQVKLIFDPETSVGFYEVDFVAYDCAGAKIQGTLCFNVEGCSTSVPAIPMSFALDCNAGQVKKNLADFTDIKDYSTFIFSGIGGTLKGDTELETPYGTLSLDLNQDIVFDYDGSDIGAIPKTFAYTFDVDGEVKVGLISLSRDVDCPFIPDGEDYSICLDKNASGTINVADLNDTQIDGVVITTFPNVDVVTNVSANGRIALQAQNDYVGVTYLEYRMVKDNVQGSKGRITIAVGQEQVTATSISICTGEVTNATLVPSIGKFEKLIYKGYLATGDDTLVQGDFPYTIGEGPLGTLTKVDYTELPCGTYRFEYNPPSECLSTLTIDVEKICSDSYIDINKTICQTEAVVDLNEGLDLTGDWIDLSGTSNLEGSKIAPIELPSGLYTFRYSETNVGTYNEVECSSTFVMRVLIVDPPAPQVFPCLNICSNGPDYDTTDCGVVVPDPDQVPDCIYDFNTLFSLESGLTIKLKEAPQFPISLHVNGYYQTFDKNDVLPTDFTWGGSVAPPGDYTFEVDYGAPCNVKRDIKLDVIPAGSTAASKTLNLCVGGTPIDLNQEADEAGVSNANFFFEIALTAGGFLTLVNNTATAYSTEWLLVEDGQTETLIQTGDTVKLTTQGLYVAKVTSNGVTKEDFYLYNDPTISDIIISGCSGYQRNTSFTGTVLPITNFTLPSPDINTEDDMDARLVVDVDGGRMIYKTTPSAIDEFNTNHVNNEIVFLAPLTNADVQVRRIYISNA